MLPTRQDVPNPLTSPRHNPASLVQTVPVQVYGDESERRDRVITAALRRIGTGELTFGHVGAHEEPLLWVPDAIAWAVGRGGDWRRRARSLVSDGDGHGVTRQRVGVIRRAVLNAAAISAADDCSVSRSALSYLA